MADKGTLISEELLNVETWLENGWFKLGWRNRPWLLKKIFPSLIVIVLYRLYVKRPFTWMQKQLYLEMPHLVSNLSASGTKTYSLSPSLTSHRKMYAHTTKVLQFWTHHSLAKFQTINSSEQHANGSVLKKHKKARTCLWKQKQWIKIN